MFMKWIPVKDIDDLLSENRDDLYRKLARGPNDINLFPSLTNPYTHDYDRDYGGRDRRDNGNNKRRRSDGFRDDYDDRYYDDYDDDYRSNSRKVSRYSEPDDRSRRRQSGGSNSSYNNNRNDRFNNNNYNSRQDYDRPNKKTKFNEEYYDDVDLDVFQQKNERNNFSTNNNNRQSSSSNQYSKEWSEKLENRKRRFSWSH